MIKNIIWDFDGSLFNTYPAQTALLSDLVQKNYNITITQKKIREYTSISLGRALQEISRTVKVDLEEMKSLFIENYSNLPLEKEYPFTHAVNICKRITAKNGKNLLNTHRGKDRLFKLLHYYDMEELFCDIISNEDNFGRKPDPESFKVLIKRNNLSLINTIVIGDRNLDILGGKRAGLLTYFFNSNNIDISGIESDYIENDLGRVLDLI
ncbi:MAG: HAD hydrolase-like protein [Bacteroidetes bacterium]|nr:HAD hydrolase-like protein [Bacteroidota bacterium]